jgi:hypothetical protein
MVGGTAAGAVVGAAVGAVVVVVSVESPLHDVATRNTVDARATE